MALSFSASSYPLYVANNGNKHKKKPNIIRSLPSSSSFILRSSSLPIKADHNTINLSEPQRIYSQENTVGIIGGVSVLSTLIFLEKFVLWSSREERETIPFIVCSDPMLVQKAYKSSIATSSSSRESVSDSNGEEISAGLDRVRLVENLREKRLFLEGGGARCIVMPCHLSHAWYGEISEGCEQPFLHVAECVVKELKEARFRPLEVGSCVKVGILASDATLVAGVYQEKLQDQGFEVVLPDKSTMENIINPAINSLKQKDMKGARNLLRVAIQVLLVKAVNTVIIASHDLQCLLPHDDPLVKKCIDPMDALARAAVRWAKSAKLHKRNLNGIPNY